MTKTQTTNWERPKTLPEVDDTKLGRTEYDIDRWKILIERVIHAGHTNDWTKAEVARRADIASGTFSQWFSGKYLGRIDEINKKIGMWLDNFAQTQSATRQAAQAPGYIPTRTATEILNTLRFAHAMSDLVAITLEAGLGKTEAGRHYCQIEPLAFRIVMRPNTKTPHGMLVDMVAALGIVEHNPAKLDRAIGDWVTRKGAPVLFIIDEAQFLTDQAIEQLRHFSDEYACGVVLLGNSEIYERIQPNKHHTYAQARSRFGKGLSRRQPYADDISALIAAWDIVDPEMVKQLTGIARKPGALRNITKTMTLASILAAGEGTSIGLTHIKLAWANRQMEDG